MAKETRSFPTEKELSVIVPEVSSWIEKELGFPPPQHSYNGAEVTILMKLKGIIRSVTGQNRIFSITFKPALGGIDATMTTVGGKNIVVFFGNCLFPCCRG